MRSDRRKELHPAPILTPTETRTLTDAAWEHPHIRREALVAAVEAILQARGVA